MGYQVTHGVLQTFRILFEWCIGMRAMLFALAMTGAPMCIAGGAGAKLGLPALTVPADNPQTAAKNALGEKLFRDARLSADGKISCASCHQPDRAFADALPVAKGLGGQQGTRNTPTLLNAAYNTSLFWDGRRATLEEQARDPFVNAREHGLNNHDAILRVVRQDRQYVAEFKQAFGVGKDQIGIRHVVKAIASFERTLLQGNSAFDRYYYGGDKQALSGAALQGLDLFVGKARCVSCHVIGIKYALLTDNQFHRLGIDFNRLAPRLAEDARRVRSTRPREVDGLIAGDPDIAALGRFVMTGKAVDVGRFRTPSLRNVALTAPYMHDGSVPTLAQAVDVEVYYRSQQAGRPLLLTEIERADLVAFLQSLTSDGVHTGQY